MNEMVESQQQALLVKVGQVFSPSAPIDNKDLFAGRLSQIKQVSDAINTRGQHAIIFGERGVGKTSLANVLKSLFGSALLSVKTNCSTTDVFDSIWRKLLSEISVSANVPSMGFGRPTQQDALLLDGAAYPESLTPADVKLLLERVASLKHGLFIIDEFDRLKGQEKLFADTIKDLSDNATGVTLILVGVARDVDELIKEHASVDRCLVQIKMPRMTTQELNDIIKKAEIGLGMTMSTEARSLVVLLSNGLPHYTHLLGKESFAAAILGRKFDVGLPHVETGIGRALEQQKQSIGAAYQKATTSQRKGTLYEEVLLACALAEVDESGYFASADVRNPLNQITHRDYDIPNFSQHLDAFSSDKTRGPVLEKAGSSRRFRFRFINPLLQPYVIMKGLLDKKIDNQLLDVLVAKRAPSDQLPY